MRVPGNGSEDAAELTVKAFNTEKRERNKWCIKDPYQNRDDGPQSVLNLIHSHTTTHERGLSSYASAKDVGPFR